MGLTKKQNLWRRQIICGAPASQNSLSFHIQFKVIIVNTVVPKYLHDLTIFYFNYV